jgi:hypothetical protein
MSSEQLTPIYLKLFEKKGSPSDKLVEEIRNISQSFNVYDYVNLETIETNPKNVNENALNYSISINLADDDAAKRINSFLQQIFRELFDNYPAFTEPN